MGGSSSDLSVTRWRILLGISTFLFEQIKKWPRHKKDVRQGEQRQTEQKKDDFKIFSFVCIDYSFVSFVCSRFSSVPWLPCQRRRGHRGCVCSLAFSPVQSTTVWKIVSLKKEEEISTDNKSTTQEPWDSTHEYRSSIIQGSSRVPCTMVTLWTQAETVNVVPVA